MPPMTTLNPDAEEDLVDAVLEELGMDPADATEVQRSLARRRIGQALTKVLSFLNRESFDSYRTVVREVWLDPTRQPSDLHAWQPLLEFNDWARYISHVPNPDDPELCDVTFEVGLSLENPQARPILDFVATEAAETMFGHALFPSAPLVVKSVSGGGQSMSWETRAANPDAAGGKLTVSVLSRFKRHNVGVSPTPAHTPWPYGGRL